MSVSRAWLLVLWGCGGAAVVPDADVLDATIPDAEIPDAELYPDGHVATEPTVEPGCMVDGCVRALASTGGFSASILRSAVTDSRIPIDNGFELWTIIYWSDGREITGTVIVPDVPPPASGFTPIVFGHGTTGLDDACAPSTGLSGAGIGGTLAVRGLLVIVPDAPGLGTPGPESWLLAEPSGRSLLDAVRAAGRLSQALALPIAPRAVIAGHSQGGHAALAAAAERATYAPELDIRGFTVASPPTELRRLLNDAIDRTDDSISLAATFFYSSQRYYGLRAPAYVVEPHFSALDTTFTHCFYDNQGNTGPLWTDFPPDGAQLFTPEVLAMAADDAWIEPWAPLLELNTPIPAPGGPPIRIYAGANDYLVPAPLTAAYAARLDALGVTVEHIESPDSAHSDTALGPLTTYQVLGEDALAWIRARLDL